MLVIWINDPLINVSVLLQEDFIICGVFLLFQASKYNCNMQRLEMR